MTELISIFIAISGLIIGTFLYLSKEMKDLTTAIHLEMKDFHGRLCSLEERRKDKGEK